MPDWSGKTADTPGVREIGTIKPVGSHRDPDGTVVFVLTPQDADMVVKGYACTRCLAKFNTYSSVCPSCGERFDDFKIRPLPEEWNRAPQ